MPFLAVVIAMAVFVSAAPLASAGSTSSNSTQSADTPTVTLTWAPPSSNGGSMITGYRVYRGTTSGQTTLLENLGVVTSYTDTHVVNGVTYYYQVSAENIIGEGPKSAERAVTTASSVKVPGPPAWSRRRRGTAGSASPGRRPPRTAAPPSRPTGRQPARAGPAARPPAPPARSAG